MKAATRRSRLIVTAALGAAALIAVVVVPCLPTTARRPRGPRYEYRVPTATGDGWVTAGRDEANLDAAPIDELFQKINDGTYPNIHSVLLVRGGRLVVEEYFAGTHPVLPDELKVPIDWDGKHQAFDRDTLHTMQSATKSVAAILVGIAIDQERIAGVDEKIATFFPEFTGRDDVRLRHFLSMTAGLEWNEWVPLTDPRNDCERTNKSHDPMALLLARPNVAPPGSTFAYNSAASVALGEVVRKASGTPVDQFAAEHLFEPLGITRYAWKGRFPSGAVHTGGGLYLRPRDMAKIGRMMLDRGRWQGRQIVDEDYVRDTLSQQAPDHPYGYQWWLKTFTLPHGRELHSAWAGGYGGQFIFLFPDLDLVVVSTAWNPENGGVFIDMMHRHILPAAR